MQDIFSLRHPINRVFDDFFYPFLPREAESAVWNWNPVVDVYEDENNFVIKAELPGIDKKDISIDLKDRILKLKGERSADNEVKEDNYYHRERVSGKFERVFTLPGEIAPEKIKADYKDGVLKIEVPKPEKQKPKKITIH